MNPISGLYKRLYWPICRAYAKYFVEDKPADAFFRFLCKIPFRRVHGFWPDFTNPHRFSEKVFSSMLHERDPIYTLISDSLLVREYVTKKVGSEYLIPLLWHGDNPEDIPFADLRFERLASQLVSVP